MWMLTALQYKKGPCGRRGGMELIMDKRQWEEIESIRKAERKRYNQAKKSAEYSANLALALSIMALFLNYLIAIAKHLSQG